MQIPKELSSAKAIREYAKEYKYDARGFDPEAHVRQAVQRGYMTPADLDQVAGWKWRGSRTRDLCCGNSPEDVKEISQTAFSTKSERLKIGALLSLAGVNWPMASVILHFAYPNRYPILDVRAMAAVGSTPSYSFKKWKEYTELCRATARQHGIDLRTLDKALWGHAGQPSKVPTKRSTATASSQSAEVSRRQAAVDRMLQARQGRATVSDQQLKEWIAEGRD